MCCIDIEVVQLPSANWGQIIVYYWIYPYYWQLLAIIAIIGYYWLLFFCKKFSYYWLLLRPAQTLINVIIETLLLQLLVPLSIIGIIDNYWQLLMLI